MIELHRRCTDLLNRMELLSEAKSANVDASTGQQKPGSKLLSHNGPVLHDEWLRRFQAHAMDRDALERLLQAGEAALALRRHGPPKIHDQIESAEFILSNYEGLDAKAVALIESERGSLCHPEYILWLRRRNDMDDMGFDRRASDGRVAMVLRMKAEGMSRTKIAKELGVSERTVSRIGAEARLAA